MSLKYAAIRSVFEVLAVTQVTGLVRALSRSRGVIFTLHRVLPDKPADFSPNAILQVTPDFLDYAIERVRDLGLDIVTLGLVYDVEIDDGLVDVMFTLTTRGCPMEKIITEGILNVLGGMPGVKKVIPNLVWEPRWHPGLAEEGAL